MSNGMTKAQWAQANPHLQSGNMAQRAQMTNPMQQMMQRLQGGGATDYGFGPGMTPQPPVDYGMGPNPNMAPPQQQMPSQGMTKAQWAQANPHLQSGNMAQRGGMSNPMQQMMQGGANSAFGRNPDPGFTMSPGAAQQVAGIMANRGQSPMQAAQGAAQSAMGGGGQKSISQALGLLGLAPAPPRSQTRSPGIRKDGSRIPY